MVIRETFILRGKAFLAEIIIDSLGLENLLNFIGWQGGTRHQVFDFLAGLSNDNLLEVFGKLASIQEDN